MKWMKAVLCSVLLGATSAAVSSDEVKESPADYGHIAVVSPFATSGGVSGYRLGGFARCPGL